MTKKIKYVDIPFIARKGLNWNAFVAARQIGKTYGIFKRMMKERIKFIWMRRTTTELTRAVEMGVFDELNFKEKENYCIDYIKSEGLGWIYHNKENKEEPIGVAMSMSTAKTYRGINYFKYNELFFDEFIPEDGAKQSASDGTACIQAFETIFGNRELPPNNLPPMKVWLASNTININDPILSALDLAERVAYMKSNNIKTLTIPNRSLYLYCGTEEGIAEAKRETSLYQLIGSNSDMAKHILDGEFRGNDIMNIKREVNLRMYKCIFDIDETVYVYMHKTSMEWYVSEIPQDTTQHFKKSIPAELRRRYGSRYAILKTCDMILYQKVYLIEYLDLLLG